MTRPIDPRISVIPGDRFGLSAAQVNALNKMMRAPAGIDQAPALATERPSNIVLVQNISGVDVPILGVVAITGVVISPAGGDIDGDGATASKAREFVRKPLLYGQMPTLSNLTQIGIAVEPVGSGKIGRFAVGGALACKVKILNDSHIYARARVNDVTQLVSASCGPVKLLWKEPTSGEDKWAVGVL